MGMEVRVPSICLVGVFVRDVSASNCAEGHVEGVDHEPDRNEQENTRL